MSLSKRIRANSEAAPWVIEEVMEMEAEIERLREACTDALQELETMNYARYKTLEQKLRTALAATEEDKP